MTNSLLNPKIHNNNPILKVLETRMSSIDIKISLTTRATSKESIVLEEVTNTGIEEMVNLTEVDIEEEEV